MAALVVSTVLMLSAVPMFFTGDSDGAPKTYGHIVTYDPNGGMGSMEDSVVTNSTKGGTPVELAANGFFMEGYSFVGWNVKGVDYQPGDTVSVPSSKPSTAVAQWSENTLEASSEDFWAVSGETYGIVMEASANNGAVISFEVSDPGLSVDAEGSVSFTAPEVPVTEAVGITVTAVATFPDGQTMSEDVIIEATVDPVLGFTNSPADGILDSEEIT